MFDNSFQLARKLARNMKQFVKLVKSELHEGIPMNKTQLWIIQR